MQLFIPIFNNQLLQLIINDSKSYIAFMFNFSFFMLGDEFPYNSKT